MTSWGAFDEFSRLEKDETADDVVVSAKLTAPFPATSGVTSSEIHCSVENGPDVRVTVDDGAGAFA
jgi:hypothetical protein